MSVEVGLVDLSEIEQNGYTLNIRKYVDNLNSATL